MATSRKNAENTVDESTAVAIREISNDELLNLSTFEDAVALVEELYGTVLVADEVIGNGFRMLSDKRKLVDEPFIILKWKFLPGDFGSVYTNMLVMTARGDKFIVNDGGMGITRDLAAFSDASGRQGGMVVRKGLSASDYTFCDECRTAASRCVNEDEHKHSPATTYYLNLTA